MNKIASIIALAAALALVSPQVMAQGSGDFKTVSVGAKKVQKASSHKGKKALKTAKRSTRKKITSHRRSPKSMGPKVAKAA